MQVFATWRVFDPSGVQPTTLVQDFSNYPEFRHDKECCRYLTTVLYERILYDLYFCGEFADTVIARYGDDGPDYMSGLGSALPPLIVAEYIAKNRGCFK